jgi:hypothetical protein
MLIKGTKMFIKGAMSTSPIVIIWLVILMTINGVLPLFFLPHLEAQISLVCMGLGGIIGAVMVQVTGWNKLLGLMHAPWVPMVYLQGHSLFFGTVTEGAFANWLLASFVVSMISLAIDFWDVYTHLRDHRLASTSNSLS